jgi:hypothetical protein
LIDQRRVAKEASASEQPARLGCSMESQAMVGESWPWRDVRSERTRQGELFLGTAREQSDQQILQGDYANPQLHQLGTCLAWRLR